MKSRLLTASVLIIAVLWIIFAAPSIIFSIFLSVFIGLAAWEWAGLLPSVAHRCSPLQIHKFLFVLIIELAWIGSFFWPEIYHYLSYFTIGLFILLIPALLTYPRTSHRWHSLPTVLILGFSFLVAANVSCYFLKQLPQGEWWLLSVLLLTWAMDTGAYFAGRFWGKRKLIPQVSPNKTWAGFWGGFILSELIVIYFGAQFAAAVVGWSHWIVIGTLAILGAVVGDLFISMLKRCVQVKDTGSLLPGHGGILDRIDSLLVSMTIVAFFLNGSGG